MRMAAAAAAKSLQSCPTLCNPIDGSPPDSTVPGILQARTLEWVAISFSNAWKWKVKVKPLSRVQLFTTPCTADYQAPPSMGFSRQEYWSGLPLPSPNENRNTSKYLGHWVEVSEVHCFRVGVKVDKDKDFPILVPNDILLRQLLSVHSISAEEEAAYLPRINMIHDSSSQSQR